MSRKLLSILACLLMALGTLPALAQVPPGPGTGGAGGAVTCGGNPCATLGAQQNVQSAPGTPAGTAITVQGDPAGSPIPVTGSLTATISGFKPSASGARMTPLTVTTSDSTATLPTGADIIVSNAGLTNPMYCNVNNIPATTSDQLIPANSWFEFERPTGVTALRCIATGGNTTANGLGGAGVATGSGGGVSGSGGGGAVTIADGADVAQGTTTDTAWSSGAGTEIALLKAQIAQLQSIVSTITAATVPVPLPVLPGPYQYTPVAGAQYNLAITSSTALTVPGTATYAVVCAKTAAVNYTTDGATTPTSTVGIPLAALACVPLSGAAVLTNFRAISATGTLTAEYFL